MAKIDNKELKVKSFRVNEDTFAKFKDIASSEFGNQSQCLEALINIYETEESKSVLVGRELEIESFQDYINKINRLFVTSLQLSSDAEDRAKEGFSKKLDAKDEVLTILKSKVDLAKEEIIELKTANKNLKFEFANNVKKIEDLETAKNILSQLSNRNYDLVSKLELEVENYKKEIAKVSVLKTEFASKDISIKETTEKLVKEKNRNDLLQKELTDIKHNINEYKGIISTKNDDIKALQLLIESIKTEHNSDLINLKEKTEQDLISKLTANEELLKRSFELDKRELELKIKELELKTK
ncbi:MAG: hypothetical protein ACRC6T_11835 [Sarcina sp.]